MARLQGISSSSVAAGADVDPQVRGLVAVFRAPDTEDLAVGQDLARVAHQVV
jgi:hypothetical protein